MADSEQLMHMISYVRSNGNAIRQTLMPQMMRSIVTPEASGPWHRKSAQFLENTRIPRVPTAGESQFADLEDPRSDQRVQEMQVKRAKMIQCVFEEAVSKAGDVKENLSGALREAIEEALNDNKVITDCAVRLLENLVASGEFPELVNILARSRASVAGRASKSSHQPSNVSVNSTRSSNLSTGTTTGTGVTKTDLTLAMKAAFFPHLMTENERATAASLGITEAFSAYPSTAETWDRS